MHSHRPRIPPDDLKHTVAFRQRIEFAQHEGMCDPQHARKGAAVICNPELGGDEETGLDGCQPNIPLPCDRNEGEKSVDVGDLFAHAAFRRRKDTMIDLEVGVSLSLPALPSGTSTFSSG